MKAIFTQSGPGLSIGQGGLGPIVTLGFGTSGAPASLGTAPTVTGSDTADLVLIQRAGELQKVPSALFAEGLQGVSLGGIMASLSPTLTMLGLEIGGETTRAELAEQANAQAISELSAGLEQLSFTATASAGASLTVAVGGTLPNLTLAFTIPPGGQGGQGPIGAGGPLAYTGQSKGGYNPVTNAVVPPVANAPPLAAGGGGGVDGDCYTIIQPGSSSITGSAVVMSVGDRILNTGGTAWVYLPAVTPFIAAQRVSLGSSTIQDDGSNQPGMMGVGPDGSVNWTLGVPGYGNGGIAASYGYIANLIVGTITAQQVIAPVAPVAPLTDKFGTALVAANPATGGLSLPGLTIIPNSDGGFEIANGLYETILKLLSTGALSLAGGITAGGPINAPAVLVNGVPVGAPVTPTTFSPTELAAFDAYCLDYSQQGRNQPNTTAQKITTQWAGRVTTGASRNAGTLGCPPVNITQPLDNYSIGQGPQGYHSQPPVANWTPLVDGIVRPLVAVMSQSNVNAVQPVRTGAIVVTQPVSVVAGSNSGTISWPPQAGLDATTVFQNQDTFQMTGWGNATSNNAQISNSTIFTVQSVGASFIVTKQVPVASAATALSTGVPQITTAPETNITIAQAGIGPFGEDPSVAFANEYRLMYLNRRGLTADPAHLFLVNGCAAAGPVALQSPANPALGNIVPTPYYFDRPAALVTAMKSAAAAPGGSLPAGSFAVHVIDDNRGGDDGSCIVTSADYHQMYDFYLVSLVGRIKGITGQVAEPLQLIGAHSGANLTEGGPPANWRLNQSPNQCDLRLNSQGNIYRCNSSIAATTTEPIGTGQNIPDGTGSWNYVGPAPATYETAPAAMGILRMMGLDPIGGFPRTYAGKNPNRYCYGPGSQYPDRGVHGANQSYAFEGCIRAKFEYRIEELGQSPEPTYTILVKVRGAQMVVGHNVPYPPLQVLSPYYFDQPQSWPDWGCTASDAVGSLTVTSISRYGSTLVVINFNRVPVFPVQYRYADNSPTTTHNGMGQLCDSDLGVPSLTKYGFTAGSGALLSDNFPNPGLLQNGVAPTLYNWNCPGSWAAENCN